MNEIMTAIPELEKRIGYVFKDKSLINEALTHSSYANEKKINKKACNERLEFLGDAVLELISSEYIFTNYPDMSEGRMSTLRASLVCEEALSISASRIGLGELIFLGKGEEQGGGRKKPSITSDAMEALIGAIYLDGGKDEAARLINSIVLDDVAGHLAMHDPKTALQEKVQAKGSNDIVYKLINESGPEHEKTFTVSLFIDGKAVSEGTGSNRKNAEKDVARAALRSM